METERKAYVVYLQHLAQLGYKNTNFTCDCPSAFGILNPPSQR
jgi:hypothetical protein